METSKNDYSFQGKHVFLSGPMTGMTDWNREAFREAERKLYERRPNMHALYVYSPAHLIPFPNEDIWPHERYMLRTLHELTKLEVVVGGIEPVYDVLVLLPGWEESEGSKIEKTVAEAIGIDIVEYQEIRGIEAMGELAMERKGGPMMSARNKNDVFDLLPCPFCGKKLKYIVERHVNRDGKERTYKYFMHEDGEPDCLLDMINMPFTIGVGDAEEDAGYPGEYALLWNRRAENLSPDVAEKNREAALIQALEDVLASSQDTVWVNEGETLVDRMVELGVYGQEVYDGARPWEGAR